ncbi:uncharacterized protein CIMG_10785 [Coccidioides immitis RS]|uniref:Uncharacterized protein n=1 Tax=Coccidioides immitis (strain RS) TaxID=246410 RepID=A0A0D8JS89_COCIM|nr:uncharacterized protein CIMG_10785 [Coccidioides immitis RS]KJF60137.1 hypothetical protein CIMG_10785 [Coccidioides immitis RS]
MFSPLMYGMMYGTCSPYVCILTGGAVCKVLFWAPASLFLSCVSPLQNLRSLSALETPGPGTVGHQGIPPPRSLVWGPYVGRMRKGSKKGINEKPDPRFLCTAACRALRSACRCYFGRVRGNLYHGDPSFSSAEAQLAS